MAGFVSDAISPLALALGTVNNALLVSTLSTGITADAEGAANMAATASTSAATTASTTSMTMWQYMQQLPMFIQQKATTIAENAANMAKQEVIHAKDRAMSIVANARQNAIDTVKEGRKAVKEGKTFRFLLKILRKIWPIFKWIYLLTQLMHVIGLWVIKTIEVIIYRIFHFKDCFLWYSLEIIGAILYAPLGFIIWLFYLHTIEAMIWGLRDEFDNMFFGTTGFHIFHYSDTILQKCYSKQFPPFPYSPLPFDDGEFTEEAFIRFVIDWFLPPSPKEIGEGVSETIELMKESEPIIAESMKIFVDELGNLFEV